MRTLVRKPDAGNPHVRFDERGVGTESMASYSGTSVPKGLVSAMASPKTSPHHSSTLHKGIGPHGPNPEGNLTYGWIGLTDGNLRITKFGSAQYSTPGGKAIFVKDVIPHPVPGARGCIVKGNTLEYSQRVAFRPGEDPMPPPRENDWLRMTDMIVDHNKIAHSAVGIYVGRGVENVLAEGNQFTDVAQPVYANQRDILWLDTGAGTPAAPRK